MRSGVLHGNFCSWPCAMAWSIDKGGSRAGERHMAMRLIMKERDGVPMARKVEPAPPKEALTCFGGELKIKEFRKGVKLSKNDGALVGFIPHEYELLVASGFEVRRAYDVSRAKGTRALRAVV